MAEVRFSAEALLQFTRLPQPIRARIQKVAVRLADWPTVSGAKALKGDLFGWYRIRTGDYRIRFFVQGEIVMIDRLGHRKDVYDD